MSKVAVNRNGENILADSKSQADWESLKASYSLEDFRMPWCEHPAIPKTSSNGVQFFAHHHGECSTAPETKWHREAKSLIVATLSILGLESREEEWSEDKNVLWRADIYFEVEHRRIVIELQRSYQHLTEFLDRQWRYVNTGVECFWLLRKKNYSTLTKSLAQYRLKRDFSNRPPKEGFWPCIPELPIAYLETDDDSPVIRGDYMEAPLRDWLTSVIEHRFQWHDGLWLIR